MRTKKIRGNKRRLKQIQSWVNFNKKLDLAHLRNFQRDYVKFRIHPWGSIAVTNSIYPKPSGRIRQVFLEGLITIYDSWKTDLDKLNQPYYLKIWLFEPRLSKSQVVCAVGDCLNFYENTFNATENPLNFEINTKSILKKQLNAFKWVSKLDEDFMDQNFVGDVQEYRSELEYFEMKKWFDTELRKPHKKLVTTNSAGEKHTLIAFEKGKVWLGYK